MQEAEAQAQVIELLRAWEHERQQAEDAGRRARGLTLVIRGYVEMFPGLRELVGPMKDSWSVPTVAVEETPRGADAVRLVMQESPDRWWLVSELVAELKGRDWLPESDNPANAIRTALERLLNSESSDVRKERWNDNKVRYAYVPDEAPPDPPPPTYDYGDEPF